MFNKRAALEALEEHGNRVKRAASRSKSTSPSRGPSVAPKKDARGMAQAARDAARTLQSLDSKVCMSSWQQSLT